MANERPRVLLVDPDPMQRHRVTTVLAIAGYHVVEVPSGRGLLAAIERHDDERSEPLVVVIGGAVADDGELRRSAGALARAGRTPPVVSLPRGRLAARRMAAGRTRVIESGTAVDELVHTVDHAFAVRRRFNRPIVPPRRRSSHLNASRVEFFMPGEKSGE
jgi:DNA-binding NtrC family response regulator